MNDVKRFERVYMIPGSICLNCNPSLLCAVVGSGIAVTLFDRKLLQGGMCYFFLPEVPSNCRPSTCFAEPSIMKLLTLLRKKGSSKENLEASLFGGAENPDASNFTPRLAETNCRKARELLFSNGIQLDISDSGGKRGRKVIFNSYTGETICAAVESIREGDWYPSITTSGGSN